MRPLSVGILDLVTNEVPMRSLFGRIMNPNLASIMPQALAVWCERAGHRVHYVCYTGFEKLLDELPRDIDLLFVGAFTQSAQLGYALSNLFRGRGVVTALGGPHARCYPEDASRYFDYVLGFTDRGTVDQVLSETSSLLPAGGSHGHPIGPPLGRCLSAGRQPESLPTLRERWKFVAPTMAKAPAIKIVPMIGSLGCPYTCSFCIDATIDYQPLDFAELRQDLAFLLTRVERPIVGWHDPNFGIRFDDYMEAIEAAVPPGRMRHIAESSLSLLSRPHLERLERNGFKAVLPGIESWFEMGNKSRTRERGMDKVRQVSEHVNLLLRHIPYVQTNFVLGLDGDQGPEPFELTKRFLDLAPGAFPAYSLNTAFGRAAPINLEYQRAGRVLPFPFHVVNNYQSMNVRPRHYPWPEFYDRVVDLSRYSFSTRSMARRLAATPGLIPRWMNLVRGISSEGRGRIRYHGSIRRLLATDPAAGAFFDGQSTRIPDFYLDLIRRELGPMHAWLPDGALEHDPTAYLSATVAGQPAATRTAPTAIAPDPVGC